jgi:transcriptional regulator with XRE-family HTH domain
MKNRLKEIRLQKGLTQQELAFKANLSLTQIRNIENGRAVPSIESVLKIKDALNCKYVEEIFSND